jgi:acetate kinase
LEAAAAKGNANAQLALDVFTGEVRRHIGGLLVELGGADVLVFTGGIGENGKQIRAAICRNLDELGIVLDEAANATATGEARISTDGSRTQVWVVPTNEEIIVARQTKQLLDSN